MLTHPHPRSLARWPPASITLSAVAAAAAGEKGKCAQQKDETTTSSSNYRNCLQDNTSHSFRVSWFMRLQSHMITVLIM